MSKLSPTDRERRKIVELASDYKAKGFEVSANVHGFESPRTIKGIKPDLVAIKGDEIIIVEVKTSASAKRSKETIEQLARYAKESPGTRFDLVITNPRTRREKVTRILDGDTFMTGNRKNPVKLADVYAPRKGKPGYSKAKERLRGFVGGEEVRIQTVARDKYGRSVAKVYKGRESINKKMRESLRKRTA